jgi:hypothetical protein
MGIKTKNANFIALHKAAKELDENAKSFESLMVKKIEPRLCEIDRQMQETFPHQYVDGTFNPDWIDGTPELHYLLH